VYVCGPFASVCFTSLGETWRKSEADCVRVCVCVCVCVW